MANHTHDSRHTRYGFNWLAFSEREGGNMGNTRIVDAQKYDVVFNGIGNLVHYEEKMLDLQRIKPRDPIEQIAPTISTDLNQIHFALLWIPPVLNCKLRSFERARKDACDVCLSYILRTIGRSEGGEQNRVRVTVQMFRGKVIDELLAERVCEPVFSAIVMAGWAKSDTEDWMQRVTLPGKIDRCNKRTELAIERLN